MIDIKNLSKEQQQYLVLGALVLVGLLFGVFVLMNRVVSVDRESRLELAELTEKIEKADRSLRGASVLRAQIAQSGEELGEMVALMPEYGSEFVWATEWVYALIQGSGIHLHSVDPMGSAPAKDKKPALIGEYAVRISGTGDYNQLRHFLTKVERDNPLVSVRSVSVSSQANSTESGHRLQIDLSWPKLVAAQGVVQ